MTTTNFLHPIANDATYVPEDLVRDIVKALRYAANKSHLNATRTKDDRLGLAQFTEVDFHTFGDVDDDEAGLHITFPGVVDGDGRTFEITVTEVDI